MMTYKDIRAALDEIREAHAAEILKWYRIRRRCLARGLDALAGDILEEISTAQRDASMDDYRNFSTQYRYLFQMDKPAHQYRILHKPGYYPGCYGDALDDC